VIAKTIGKEQTQQVHRVFYHASLHKSAGLPRAALKKRRATKPFYEIFPVPINKRFVSHLTLNHKPIRLPRHILTPMREGGGMAACSAWPVAILRDARKRALLRMRLMDGIDMIRTSETLHYFSFS
jgi:hypothetical protein